MAQVKMIANKSFKGREGKVKRGDTFLSESEARAKILERRKLAKRAALHAANQQTTGPSETATKEPDETKDKGEPETPSVPYIETDENGENSDENAAGSCESMSFKKLQEAAREKEIEGRSKMDREELIKALEKAGE